MAESFGNLDSILHDWAKDKYNLKNFVKAMMRYEQEKER